MEMSYRIVFDTLIIIQYILLDFIGLKTEELIDCRTIEGQMRFKELYGQVKLRTMLKNYNTASYHGITSGARVNIFRGVQVLLMHMGEHLRRLFAGLLTYLFVVNPLAVVAELTGLDQKTVRAGRQELDSWSTPYAQADRTTGAGRPTKEEEYSQFSKELDSLLDNTLTGDPMSGRKWIRKNLRWLVDQLSGKGIHASPGSVSKRFKEKKVSLRVNKKVLSSKHHPDRNSQFEQNAKIKKDFLRSKMRPRTLL